MPELLTFDDVRALSEPDLNAAIDEHCYGHVWRQVYNRRGDTYYEMTDADGSRTGSSVPYFHHTAHWERVMPLAWRALISLRPRWYSVDFMILYPEWAVQMESLDGHADELVVMSEPAARVAICRLALWETIRPRPAPEKPEA